jgi:hypothetical protein
LQLTVLLAPPEMVPSLRVNASLPARARRQSELGMRFA